MDPIEPIEKVLNNIIQPYSIIYMKVVRDKKSDYIRDVCWYIQESK